MNSKKPVNRTLSPSERTRMEDLLEDIRMFHDLLNQVDIRLSFTQEDIANLKELSHYASWLGIVAEECVEEAKGETP